MKTYIYLLTLLSSLLALAPMHAQDVTFSKDIAPIIYNNCTTCHRQGEVGPMPLTNYSQVSAWGAMIEYVTDIKYMPPWKADPEYSRFLDERFLKDTEIQLIKDWVAAGMPQGDPDLEPALPAFPEGSQVGEPDLVLSFEEAYEHYGGNEDEYRVFVLPTGLVEDKNISTVELRPGNPRIVHHALFTYDDSGAAQINDANDPGYGYDGFGGFGVNGVFDKQFPGFVPGQKPREYPEGTGQLLPAGSDLLIQMHYAPVPFPQTDSSTVNIFFTDGPVERYVQQDVMLPFGNVLQNGPFVIPPNQVRTFHGEVTINQKVSLLGIAPHMHLLGQNWQVYAEAPDGEITNLISIPEWDFNWQGMYNFREFKVLEPGTKIHGIATYDNTADNPLNPNNPPQWVSWGEGTADEMYYLAFFYVPYFDGDEDIMFEDQVTSTDGGLSLKFPEDRFYPVYPNPTSDELTVGFSLAQMDEVTLEILDISGKPIKTLFTNTRHLAGPNKTTISTGALPNGVYILQLKTPRFQESQQFTIMK
ncbi:MAG: T9SS type A sorting domain-containing protein [Bacteroidota bacterium]